MLDRFIQALLQEIIQILIKNPEFFNMKNAERSKILSDIKIPSVTKEYLENVDQANFFSDIRKFAEYTKNRSLDLSANEFLKSVAHFLVNSFTNEIYALPVEYFKLNLSEQKLIVDKLITSDSLLGETLREILINYSSQEINNNIQLFLQSTIESPLVIVQSPVEIDAETKKDMRNKLNESLDKACFPIFQVNRNLIGGLRIFVNGVVKDYSWIKSINFITSLK